jgi:heparosan-N-sulfate-glucuronate 5-epimerase
MKVSINKKYSKNKFSYFITSDELFNINLKNQSENLIFINKSPMFKYAFGNYYNPAYVCWWALINLEEFVKTGNEKFKNIFLDQAKWLLKNAKDRKSAKVWTYDFNWNEGKTKLKKGWISAMSQGLAISVLVRAYYITKNKKFLRIAYDASKIFKIDIEFGGVSTTVNKSVFYEEYPAYPLVHVLDGFIFSLLGLYDLYLVEKNNSIKILFKAGSDSIENNFSIWDHKKKWSFYGTRGLLCTPKYNKLNSVLLNALFNITNKDKFKEYSNNWNQDKFSFVKKTSCYYDYFIFWLKYRLNNISG